MDYEIITYDPFGERAMVAFRHTAGQSQKLTSTIICHRNICLLKSSEDKTIGDLLFELKSLLFLSLSLFSSSFSFFLFVLSSISFGSLFCSQTR